MPILAVHIDGVVFCGSKPKVVWVDARAGVAFVQHPFVIRYWPEVHFVRNAVGGLWPAVLGDLAITMITKRCRPKPAS